MPWPLMLAMDSPDAVVTLAADKPDGDSVATRLFPEASVHVRTRVCDRTGDVWVTDRSG